MQQLSRDEISALATLAGFTGADLEIAVAIAQAESGGYPDCIGDVSVTPPYGSIGLWQINVRWHPVFTRELLFSPIYNAMCAYAVYISEGRNFTAWATFKSGAYKKYVMG